MAETKTTLAAKAARKKSPADRKRVQNAPRAKHNADAAKYGLAKCDPKTQEYHHGCIDGEHRAELCIQEFRQRVGCIGSGMMYGHIERIRGKIKDPRINGMLVGFCSTLEKELGRLFMEDAWRNASANERWNFTEGLRESRARAKQLKDAMLAKMDAGEEPTSEEWSELLSCSSDSDRTVLAAIRAVRAEREE